MITLDNISIFTPGPKRRKPILLEASAEIKTGERVGILALPGSGKTTVARVLSGIVEPDKGKVISEGRVSWPIGFAGFLHPFITVESNLRDFARFTGMPPREVMTFCVDFFEDSRLIAKKMSELTPTQRALLAWACCMSVRGPATWIADEVITVGEPRDRERCEEILAERLEHGTLIFISRNVRLINKYCDRYFVLINKRLVPCSDPEVAKRALEHTVERRFFTT